jgi:hypothetical protein
LQKFSFSQEILYGKDTITTWTISKDKNRLCKNRNSLKVFFLRGLRYWNFGRSLFECDRIKRFLMKSNIKQE